MASNGGSTSGRRKYPIVAGDYELFEEIGRGVSAGVYRARCVPLEEIVAIKVIDLERNNNDLSNISREAQTMALVDHPNVLKAHCSFVNDRSLWVVMPYMAGGSCLSILKSVYPEGFKENVIATIMKEVLNGLGYLHSRGFIHRDVKAGNILLDARGVVKLGDFGVSACLFDSGDRQRARNTFVGTPCWMAPEVMEQLHGYDFKADIWSFGITALELAHGNAPFSEYPPMKVLMMTLTNSPPTLTDKKFSKHFRHMIGTCLVKDPSRRPSAQKLLKHPFFRNTRSKDYINRTILEGLAPLGDRIRALKVKEDMLSQKQIPEERREVLSQCEYKRGISTWNFDIEDLKIRAELEIDDVLLEKDTSRRSSLTIELSDTPSGLAKDDSDKESFEVASVPATPSPSSQMEACQRSKSPGCNFNIGTNGSNNPSTSVNGFTCNGHNIESSLNVTIKGKQAEPMILCSSHERRYSASCSASGTPEYVSKLESVSQDPNLSIGVSALTMNDLHLEAIQQAAKISEDTDGKSMGGAVQKGRFKVTSENVDIDKTSPLGLSKSRSIQDLILNTIKQISTGELSPTRPDAQSETMPPNISEKTLLEMAHDREKQLVQENNELRWRLICMQEELQRLKTRSE